MKTSSLVLAKKIAHQVWDKYDDTFGYRTEKQEVNDRASTANPYEMYFYWQQFDSQNQTEFLERLKDEEDCEEKIELLKWIADWVKETSQIL